MVMRLVIPLCGIAVIILLFAGCAGCSEDTLTAATARGENTMSYRINGEVDGIHPVFPGQPQNWGVYLTDKGKPRIFANTPGYIDMLVDTPLTVGSHRFYHLEAWNPWYSCDSCGKFEITVADTAAHVLAGRFEGTVVNDAGDTKVITDGRFDFSVGF